MRWVLQTPRIWNRRPHSRTDWSRPRSVPVNAPAVSDQSLERSRLLVTNPND